MKKRTIATALIAGGVAVGVYVSGWLPKLGNGELGLGGGAPAPQEQHAAEPSPPAAAAKPQSPAESVDAPHESGAGPREFRPDVLHVLIDGRQYLVRKPADGGEEYQPATLDEVVELAQATPGDEDGIRVRINRRGSARATAEIALRDRFTAAGLPPESIREQVGLTP
jgi:hypothetical protein